jgi:hypothetical protein
MRAKLKILIAFYLAVKIFDFDATNTLCLSALFSYGLKKFKELFGFEKSFRFFYNLKKFKELFGFEKSFRFFYNLKKFKAYRTEFCGPKKLDNIA